jgi:hypothetical protein
LNFLHPAFLFGLFAAGIPILLHFLRRREVQEIPFAPMRFLKPSQEQQSHRLRLRRLLLLALRVAALVCIVLALARPTVTGGLSWLAPSGTGVSVLVMVDDSASMRAQASGGSLFDLAREQANEIAAGLSASDEFALAVFDTRLHPLLEDFVRDPNLALAQLRMRECGFSSTSYAASLDKALDFLERAAHPHREIYLVSDFQRAPADSVARGALAKRLAARPDTHVFLRQVAAEPFVNRQVEEVRRPAALLHPGETAEISVSVRQNGEKPLGVQVFLTVQGEPMGETEIQLNQDQSESHSFPVTLPEAGDLAGSARLRPDRFPPDDQRFFVVEVTDRVPVLVLRGFEQTEARRDPLLFLAAALDPDESSGGDFALTSVECSRLDVETLSSYRVVLAADPKDFGAARLAALSDYLRSGGTMLLFCGDPREREYANEKLLPTWTTARLSPFRGGEESIEHLEVLARNHPIFQGFSRQEIATLEEAKLRDFYRIEGQAGQPLVEYRGGGVAVSEFKVGEGRLLLCGFHPSATSGDLPFSPMFLPFTQRASAYLATAAGGGLHREIEVGQELSCEAPAGLDAESRVELRTPAAQSRPVEVDATAAPPRLRFGVIDAPGLYTITVDDSAWAQFAANVPAVESERTFTAPEEFTRAVFGGAARGVRALQGENVAQDLQRARTGRPVHRLFLLLAGLFLLVESLLGRRVSLGGER